MDLVDALDQTFDHAHTVIAGVRADQLTNPTPCREWDVAALLTHVTGGVTKIGAALQSPPVDPPSDFKLADDAATQFRTAADGNLAAWRTTGLEGETNIGAGPMPKQAAISINLLDTLTHAWDVARATGQPEQLPDELAGLVLGICQGFVTDDIRKFAGFDPPVAVPQDAGRTDQLVAFLGRQP
jgi:uncharacterized protein (TIGR03086 family)